MHDNRIFGFEHRSENVTLDRDEIRAELLTLLTVPKYRILSSLYFVFRLLDNTALLAVVVLSIINGSFTQPTAASLLLFGVVGVELFYDVLLQVSQLWIMRRLNLWFGIVLFGAYFAIAGWEHAEYDEEFPDKDYHAVIYILVARLGLFLIEESLDYAIDVELDHDLRDFSDSSTQDRADGSIACLWCCCCWPCLSVGNQEAVAAYLDPNECRGQIGNEATFKYVGSFSAWWSYSVYTRANFSSYPECFPCLGSRKGGGGPSRPAHTRRFLVCFLFIPVLLMAIPLLAVAILSGIVFLFAFAIQKCAGNTNYQKLKREVLRF